MKKRVFSGIQPSGSIHIGNYLGAIKQWLQYQEEYESIFSIVDLHAITVRQDPDALRQHVRKAAALYLACGIDPEKSILFVQSHVPQHTQLAWILNTFTQMGELERMTQFKDKSKKSGGKESIGLFTYPVLMAADILLYNTSLVPVGDDQKQHLELARNIALRVNNHYSVDLFTVPEARFLETGSRIMGLNAPDQKMSKSATSIFNYIAIDDEPDMIRKKIMKAVTDTGSTITFDDEQKPGISNLLTIYSLITDRSIPDLEKEYAMSSYGDFKKDLADTIIAFLSPIQEKMQSYENKEDELDDILEDGAQRATAIAEKTLEQVYHTTGLR